MLVSEEYGRSLSSGDTYLVTPDEKIYNFQSFPQIHNVSQNSGSNNGGTNLDIHGLYFYSDENLPASIEIGGI